ncbi:unnamed protein product [Allacma fusca]|uniref:Proteasome maturation protein n=1 Tax=Allacma fusca TaxID=39272 RepID=A0A8J2PE40_9HEXA|nr:unnamed protein product [Allacma fusca]
MSSAQSVSSDMASPMVYGLGANSKRSHTIGPHPLELSEKTFQKRQEEQEFYRLRKLQGLHVPLKLKMERKITLRSGHLPFLPRSNASYDVLTGRDELITFEDFLGHRHEPESMGQPHAMVEKQIGLL